MRSKNRVRTRGEERNQLDSQVEVFLRALVNGGGQGSSEGEGRLRIWTRVTRESHVGVPLLDHGPLGSSP